MRYYTMKLTCENEQGEEISSVQHSVQLMTSDTEPICDKHVKNVILFFKDYLFDLHLEEVCERLLAEDGKADQQNKS